MISQNTHRIAFISLILLCLFASMLAQDKRSVKLSQKAEKRLGKMDGLFKEWQHLGTFEIDSLDLNSEEKKITIYFSKSLSYLPVRENSIDRLESQVRQALRKRFQSYELSFVSNSYEFSDLVPNSYRNTLDVDEERLRPDINSQRSVVKNTHQAIYEKGLSHKHVALWHSHGYYFEHSLDRWEWQRARLFSTVEDLLPMSFVIPYLTPMLENSGAYVLLPRERDFQTNEVIVDNDGSSNMSKLIIHSKNTSSIGTGFALCDTFFPGDNPFSMGTSLHLSANSYDTLATYLPDFPQTGRYAVYVSYQKLNKQTQAIDYTINHTGGSTVFEVDQSMGEATWLYLGHFDFKQGMDANIGSVSVAGEGDVSIDAIRFGGGVGNVARKGKGDSEWKISGKPRYMEAARYYMQYSGVPDSLAFSFYNEQNDYKDDYQSRGEWVNYLMGLPNGPQLNREAGLNIPIDLAFAFHTDAGTTTNDSVIGTLGIYSSLRDDGVFPNGQSKLASRDLTDMVQSQLLNDINAQYNMAWTRRAMWDKQYSEAWRPNVPTMLLELLSHQNLADMKYALDPNFRFDVSRSIYKAILKYLAYQNGTDYVVQALPVDHMAIQVKGDKFELSWQAVEDPLEETASPTRYKVYKRVGHSGFDNGVICDRNSLLIKTPAKGETHSYKVTAINEGGESMPSEILTLGTGQSKELVLVLNAFDRVAGPAFIDENNFAGIVHWEDEGVADGYDYSYVGTQYDYNRQSPWLDDDSPGWGASYGNEEGQARPGNSFDFSIVHGEAIMAAGYSFVSMSDEAFYKKETPINSYLAIDILLGEEKVNSSDRLLNDYRVFSKEFLTKLDELRSNNSPLMMSGAYIASDMVNLNDTLAIKFAKEKLGYQWRTNHAITTGGVRPTDVGRTYFKMPLVFNTSYHPTVYKVEAPDAIEAYGDAHTVYRYTENNSSAVVYNDQAKVLIMGFPFESIIDEQQRNSLMKEILEAFTKKQENEK